MELSGIKKVLTTKKLSVLDYKKQQRTFEVNKLEGIIEEKTLKIKDLELKTEQIDNTLFEKSDKLTKVENKLSSMLKDAKTIDNNVRKFDENPEWQLEEPSLLMTASAI